MGGGGAGGVIRFPAACMLIFVGLSIVSDATTFFEFTAALSNLGSRARRLFRRLNA